MLIVDPWNEIEHARRRDEAVTDYIGRAIRAFKRFGQQFGVSVIIIAHPTKEVGRDGKHRTPTLYDIEGSAHWFNKCDHGIVIERPDPMVDESNIWIAKSRFEASGEKGMIRMKFDRYSGRYVVLDQL